MKYMEKNKNIIPELNNCTIESWISAYEKRLESIENRLEILMDKYSIYRRYLIKDGKQVETDVAYQEIYKSAKKSIYVIDDYIDVKTLLLLKLCNDNVEIIIITDNKGNYLNNNFINEFKNDTKSNIIFKENNDKFHERYIVIDFNTNNYLLYICDVPAKDSYNKITVINTMQEKDVYISLINEALNNKELVI